MQKNENNPNFFRRKPQIIINKPWLTYSNSSDHDSNYRNAGNSNAVGTRNNSFTNTNLNIKNKNHSQIWKNSKQSSVVVSNEISNPLPNLTGNLVPHLGRIQRKLNVIQHQSNHQNRPQIGKEKHFQPQFNKKPQFIKQLYSILENKDTDLEKFVKHQSTLSDHTNKSITEHTHHQAVNSNFPSNDLDTEFDYNSVEISGDLNKLQMMTAIDLDRDRYARYKIHEMEMKDYVRIVTFKNCLEYCAEKYIKVNIKLKNQFVLVITNFINCKNSY